MRRTILLTILSTGLLVYLVRQAPVADAPAAPPVPPFGIAKRIPWTTSRVAGSPEPPLPYRVRRSFPRLKIPYPIAVAHEPGTDQLLLIHQLWPWVGPGRIVRVKDDSIGQQTEVVLSLDRTLYGLAFHPNFLANGYIYVGSNGPVTPRDRDLPGRRFRPGVAKTTRISRFTIARKPPFACDPRSEQVILEWPSNGHNGGDLAFGRDGLLYISSGDGSADSDVNLAGQDLGRLPAKVLRIDVEHPTLGKAYAIPADNPFLKLEGARPETWAYGLRNPWRLHSDSRTGDLWVGNNGQDLWEQVYLVERGRNYGWSLVEGTHPFYPQRRQGPTPISKPIVEHSHAEARSVTGGLVSYGAKLPDLRGAYLYGDWSTGKIWGVRHKEGKVVWHRELANTTLQITGFGTDSKGELLIVDYGGGLYHLEPAPRDTSLAKFPTRLSETGLFTNVSEHRPEPALIPYSVNAPLWSDGAEKERFLALPGMAPIDFTSERGWNFPDGTVLVKTFSLLLRENDPKSRRRIETRLLTRQQGQWAGYSYVWNDEQNDATLVEAGGLDRVHAIEDPAAPNGKRRQTWHYPSRAECLVCHSRAANFVLGLSVLQMNKDHDYGGVTDNQLRALEHIGALRVSSLESFRELKRQAQVIGQFVRLFVPAMGLLKRPLQEFSDQMEERLQREPAYSVVLPKRPEQYARLVNPYDGQADLNARARSYLHANCAQCHVTAGGGNAAIDLEFTTARERTGLIGIQPRHQSFDIRDPLLIAPGQPRRSILWERVHRRGPGQMPPLASSRVDRAALRLLDDWITNLKSD